MPKKDSILVGPIGVAFLATMVLLAGSAHAAEDESQPIRVEILLEGSTDAEVAWVSMESLATSLAGAKAAERALTEDPRELEADLYLGELVLIGHDESQFLYPFRGTEQQPLKFEIADGLGWLNGELICVDLHLAAAATHMAEASLEALGSVRSVILSGDVNVDIPVLERLPRKQVVLTFR